MGHIITYRIFVDDDTATMNYVDCDEKSLAKNIGILQKAGQIIKSVERILHLNYTKDE